jgi:transformation/transcription domain-associated protein
MSVGVLLTRSSSVPPQLSIDIVELVLKWDRRRTGSGHSREETESGKRSADGDLPSPKRARLDRAGTAVSTSSAGGWAPPPALRESIVSYLVRFVAMSHEPIALGGLCSRAFELLKDLLGPTPWSPASVKLIFFQRTLITVRLPQFLALGRDLMVC